jgi:hypothetical protein
LQRFGPGSWVGLYNQINFAGAYGLPVQDRHGRGTMLLTAAHVIGGLFPFSASETEVIGYGDVAEADAHDTTTSAQEAIQYSLGRLRRSIPPSPSQECTVDAAIAEVTSGRELKNHVEGRPIAGVRDIREMVGAEVPVRIFGARSNLRRGVLSTAPVTEQLELGKGGRLVTYRHACHIHSVDDDPFADRGDSGSIAVDDDCYAVAMVVGQASPAIGTPPPALAIPMAPILEELEVDVYTDESMITVY